MCLSISHISLRRRLEFLLTSFFLLNIWNVHRILFRSIDNTLYVTYCYPIYMPCLLLCRSGAMVSILLDFAPLERSMYCFGSFL